MSLTGGFYDLYSFLNDQATDYTYGYDTRPGLTSPSPLKERILKAFTMPGVEVFFRRASDNPCTDHGDDLSTKPRLFLNTLYGCGIEIPSNVYMDIRGPLGKDHLIKIKFKDSIGRSQIYQYIDTFTASDKECITIAGSVDLYVTEVNYLLNPRYAYVDLDHNKHLWPIYSENGTSNLYGRNFDSNPVSPTAASYASGPTGVNYYNLDGYGIGTNKQVAGICDSRKYNNYGQKTFAYAKSLTASYQPATPLGLFSTSNTVPELLNMQLTPIVIYADGQKDPNNPNLTFSHYRGDNNEHTQITVFHTNGSSDTYKLQEDTDYFVTYKRTAITTGRFPAGTDYGYSCIRNGDYTYNTSFHFGIYKEHSYSLDNYDTYIDCRTSFLQEVIKYDYQGTTTDITQSFTPLDNTLKQIGLTKSISREPYVFGYMGAAADTSKAIDVSNAESQDGGNTSSATINTSTYFVTVGRVDKINNKNQAKLVNTRGVIRASWDSCPYLSMYPPDLTNSSINMVSCTLEPLAHVDYTRTYYDSNSPDYMQVSTGNAYQTSLSIHMNWTGNIGLFGDRVDFGLNTTSFGLSAYYPPSDSTTLYQNNRFVYATEAGGHRTYTLQAAYVNKISFGVRATTSTTASLEIDMYSNYILSNSSTTFKAIVGGTHHPRIQ